MRYLPIACWLMMAAGAMAQSNAFIAQTASTADTDAYTFSTQSLGDAAADRVIIVSVASRDTVDIAVSSVTIGGVSASNVVQTSLLSSGAYSYAGIWQAEVPTGTTGDIVVTFTGAQVRCIIDTYRATSVSLTPVDTDYDVSSPDPAKTLTTGAGFAVGMVIYPATSAISWTNLDEWSESVTETNTLVSSASDDTTAGTLAITGNVVGSVANSIGVFATWEYAEAEGSAVPVIVQQLHKGH